jgi:hypothetical protein
MESFVSFRSNLSQVLDRFTVSFNGQREEALMALVETALGISDYREEGMSLAPAVFISTQLDSLLLAISGKNPVPIGAGPFTSMTVRTALKACAPLGSGRQWAMYLIISPNAELSYGVFMTTRSPLTETSFEQLRHNRKQSTDATLIGITRIGESIVEVRSTTGDHQYIDFSGAAEISNSPALTISNFVETVTRDVSAELKRKFEVFYYRIVVEALGSPHGTLTAVLKAGSACPLFLADGIWLSPPLSLEKSIEDYAARTAQNDVLNLTGYAGLIRQFMMVDGITVFSTDGKILAYNCFVRHPTMQILSKEFIGGARRRAYEILCASFGDVLVGALYKSQDGTAECRTAAD